MTLSKGNKVRNSEKNRSDIPFQGYQQSRHKRSLTVDNSVLDYTLPLWEKGELAEDLFRSTADGVQRAGSRSATPGSAYTSGAEGHVHKVVLLGDHGVGKSSLARIFGEAEEGPDCDEAGSTYNRSLVVDEEEATVLLYDVWEQDSSPRLKEECMCVGDAYVIVYSVTDRASFEKASELRIQLRTARHTDNIPIILVGNKSDLVRSREVSVEEGRACAMVFDCKFIETSAVLNHNVQHLFEGIVRQIRLRKDSKEQNARWQANLKRRESIGKKAKRFISQMMARKNRKMAFRQKSKSCHDLSVL